MPKRRKVKLTQVPVHEWLPTTLEELELTQQELEEYTPRLSKHLTLEDAYRLVCNKAAHRILVQLHQKKARVLRELYQDVCRSRWPERNRTYTHQMIVYRVCTALGLMTPRMTQNYQRLILQGPSSVSDIFGGTWRTAKKGGKGRTKKPKGETVIGTIVECLKRTEGATKVGILKVLTKKFPERKSSSMKNTIGVQLSSQLKKKYGGRLQKTGDIFRLT